VITISEKEHNHEKEVEERLRREIKEDFKKKKGRTRKLAGLIISGVGGLLYLINGFVYTFIPLVFISWLIVPFSIAGVIALIGPVIGIFKVKIGGVVSLIVLPISLVIGFVLSHNVPYPYSPEFTVIVIEYLIIPVPLPHSIHVITGGIFCLLASDK